MSRQQVARPEPAGKSALVGAVLGVDAAGLCLALATLGFADSLSAGRGLATTIFVAGTILSTLALIWRGGFRLSISITQDTTIAILAPAVALAAASTSGPEVARLGTAFAVIGVSALASGAVFWLVGRFRLGDLVRMFPYPVAAGFLASSGFLLVNAALTITLGPHAMHAVLGGEQLLDSAIRLAPMLGMTLCLFLGLRFLSGSTAVILVILVFLAGFYLWLWSAGVTRDAAVSMGLLPAVSAGIGDLDLAGMIGGIDWHAVALTAPTMVAVIVLNLIGVLLNTTGLELATGDTVDINRELQVTGQANLVIGLLGGLASFLQGGASILANRLGVSIRPFLAGHLGVLTLAAVLAGPIVAAVPVFVAAGLLMFIGVGMLWDWLVLSRKRLVPQDWAIVVGIVGLTMAFGILPAIVMGVLMAVVSFAVGYARLPVLRHATHAAARVSIRDRPPAARVFLAEQGHRIRILHLQGALFFGSVDQLSAQVRSLRQDIPDLHSVILDLRGVQTFDSSASAALGKLGDRCAEAGVAVWLVDMAPPLLAVLRRWGLTIDGPPDRPGLRTAASLDDALEAAEDDLLIGTPADSPELGVADTLARLSGDHPRIPDLTARMDRLDLAADALLIRADEPSQDVYFLQRGQLAIFAPDRRNGRDRVRSMGPGSVIGEMAYLTQAPRVAEVRAELPSVVYRLKAEEIDRMRRDDPDLAALLAFVLGRAVSEKLTQANRVMASLRVRADD